MFAKFKGKLPYFEVSLKQPGELYIADDKVTRYLLVRQERGDKSQYLESAGYNALEPHVLKEDLFKLAKEEPAVERQRTLYGQFFELKGALQGPNGKILNIRTIWMKENLSGNTKFITLIPD